MDVGSKMTYVCQKARLINNISSAVVQYEQNTTECVSQYSYICCHLNIRFNSLEFIWQVRPPLNRLSP